jgi:hypothetical protein
LTTFKRSRRKRRHVFYVVFGLVLVILACSATGLIQLVTRPLRIPRSPVFNCCLDHQFRTRASISDATNPGFAEDFMTRIWQSSTAVFPWLRPQRLRVVWAWHRKFRPLKTITLALASRDAARSRCLTDAGPGISHGP